MPAAGTWIWWRSTGRARAGSPAIDERKVRIVELRYFGGLSDRRDGRGDGTRSPTTVKREWTIAKAWLFRDLTT